jgi:hypothetical protein
LDTIAQKYLVPTVRAAVKLQERDPEAAIDLLREAIPYDLAFTESFDYLYQPTSAALPIWSWAMVDRQRASSKS